MRAKHKEDFSAFDIFQHISPKHKKVALETTQSEGVRAFGAIDSILRAAKKQLLIFSGNLSFINFHKKGTTILDTLAELIKQGIYIKILCRVDLSGIKNVESMLALNFKHAKEMVEIRHREQPLRATIVDNSFFDMKEIKEPTGKIRELDKELFIFYTVNDKDWVEWLTRIFYRMFSESIDANKRLEELKRIK